MDQIEFSLWKLSAPCKPNVVKNPSVHICFEVCRTQCRRKVRKSGGAIIIYYKVVWWNRFCFWIGQNLGGNGPLYPPCSTGHETYCITYVLSEILEMYLLQSNMYKVQLLYLRVIFKHFCYRVFLCGTVFQRIVSTFLIISNWEASYHKNFPSKRFQRKSFFWTKVNKY